MSDWRDWDDTASLAAVALDDMLVDALVAGDVADETDPAFMLLAALRADVEAGSGDGLTVTPLRAPWRKRARRLSRGAVAASAAVVTVLSAGGVAAASVGAGPDSVLYPVRKVLVGPVDSPIDSVYRLLNGARESLDQGDTDDARAKVAAARDKLQSIGDDTDKARSDLTRLENAVAEAQAPEPAAEPTTDQALQDAAAGDTTDSTDAGPATESGDTDTATTVDRGSQVDSDVTPATSPEPSSEPSPSTSPTASPSPSPSPSSSPTDPSPSPSSSPTGPQQPRATSSPSPSAQPASASVEPAPSPTSS